MGETSYWMHLLLRIDEELKKITEKQAITPEEEKIRAECDAEPKNLELRVAYARYLVEKSRLECSIE